MERHGLDTMDKIFDYVTTVSFAFLSLKNQNPFAPFSSRPTLKMRHWELEKSLEKKMKSNQMARFSSKESNICNIFCMIYNYDFEYRKFVLGTYNWMTFEDFACQATIIGQAFKSIGIKPKDRIAILAETRAEWMITAYACFKNNITIVTIYTVFYFC